MNEGFEFTEDFGSSVESHLFCVAEVFWKSMEDLENIRKIAKKYDASFFDFAAACEQHGISQEDVDELREMSKSTEEVPTAIIDRFFLIILVGYDNDKEKSLTVARKYCAFFRELPEFFANRDVESLRIRRTLDHQIFAALPASPENYHVFFHKLFDYDPENYFFNSVMATLFLTIGEKLELI
jgi:hypothetical protein